MNKTPNASSDHLIGSSLKLSEETVRLLFKNIPIPTLVWQKQDQDFILVDYNDVAIVVTDGKIVGLLGARVDDLYPDLPEIKQELLRCFTQKTSVEKQRLFRLRTTGETRHVSAKYVFVPPDLVVIHGIDITLHKETEKKLSDSESRYQELANLLPQTIFETDASYNITYSNQAGFDAFGYTPEDLTKGLNIFELIIPEEREKAVKNTIKVMQGEKSGGNEYTALRKDGSTFPANVFSLPIIRNGKIIGLRGILIDISKLKAAQIAIKKANEDLENRVNERTAKLAEANTILKAEIAQRLRTQEVLKQNEEKYRAVVEQSVECVLLVDLDTKYIIEANPAFQRLLGYSTDEVQKLQVYDFIAHDREDIDQKISMVQESGAVFLSQRKYRKKNGKLIELESSASLICYQNKKVICIVSRDISERIRADNIQQAIYQISGSISETKDLNALLQSIQQILGKLVDTTNFYIILHNENDNSISIPYFVDDRADPARTPMNKASIRKVIEQGRSILINSNFPAKMPRRSKSELQVNRPRSWLGVPLKLENKTFGAVVVQSHENAYRFGQNDLEVLELVSNQIALAIAYKKTEDELKAVHQIYREAIENAQGVPYKFSYSKNTYDMLGKQAKELMDIDVNELTFDRLRASKQKIIVNDQKYSSDPLEYGRAYRRGEISKYRTDFMIMTSRGEEKWISDCAVPIKDDKTGKVIGSLGILQDITERKRVEQALQASEQSYRHVVEDQTELICRHLPDGTLTFANEACCRFFNKTPEEIIGAQSFPPLPNKYLEPIRKHRALLSLKKPIISYEHQMIRPDGKVRWFFRTDRAIFDKQGVLQEYQSVARDITARKRAEEELEKYRLRLEDLVKERTQALTLTNQKLHQELIERKKAELALQLNQRRYELLYEENPSMYFTIDLKGKILSVNKFGAEQLGYSVAELIGKPVDLVIYKEDKKIVQRQIEEMRISTKQIDSWEFRKVCKDGRVIWVKESARRITDDDGKSLILIVCEDITARIKAQNEREKLLKELAEREKLATLGQLTAAITHEINNPLDIIMTDIDTLKDEYYHLPELLAYAENIKDQVFRINRMAGDILSYAKPHHPEFVTVDVNKILVHTIESLQSYFHDKIKLATKFKPNLPMISADAIGLEIVFKNIILNAIQSIEQEGTVNISTQFKNDQLRITIRDNGAGIEKFRLKKIFDQFYTSKSGTKGTGLGLAISLEIVKKHHGVIKVKSQPGEGTKFQIYLPAHSKA